MPWPRRAAPAGGRPRTQRCGAGWRPTSSAACARRPRTAPGSSPRGSNGASAARRTSTVRSCSTDIGLGVSGRVDRVDVSGGRRASCATTRAARCTRPRAGRRSGASRSRSTCSPCASCSASSRSPGSTSRSPARSCSARGLVRDGRRRGVGPHRRRPPTRRSTRRSEQARATAVEAARRDARRRGSARARTLCGYRRLRLPDDLPGGPVSAVAVAPFTSEQRAAIDERDGLVRCSPPTPGSGKTAVIVERFAEAVLERRRDGRRASSR